MTLTSWLREQLHARPMAHRTVAPLLRTRRRVLDYVRSRRLAELHANVHDGTLVVSVGDFPGRYQMDVRSHILQRILAHKRYESHLVGLARKYVDPRRDAIDVGANVGLYTTLFASMLEAGRRVVAIEPTPNALDHLHANLKRNECENVVVVEGVVSDHEGTSELHFVRGREEYSSVGRIVHPFVSSEPMTRIEVRSYTIDGLVAELHLDPGFVKIDVEGAEASVLRGASRLLATARPVILSELSEPLLKPMGSSVAEAVDLLEDADYRVFDCETMRPIQRIGFNGNVLAIPR